MSEQEFDPYFDPEAFSGTIPIFPLPEVVLFPNMLLPLHIFEPRYRQMVTDALDGDKLIGMAKLMKGWQTNYYGAPAVHERLGMGKIVKSETLADGRFNILLLGLCRTEIIEESTADPYRKAQVILLGEDGSDEDSDTQPTREKLTLAYQEFVKLGGEHPSLDSVIANAEIPLGTLTDALSSTLKIEPDYRQQLLNETNIHHRSDLLIEWIRVQLKTSEFYDQLDHFDSGDPRLN